MKKTISLVIAIIFMLSLLTGCGNLKAAIREMLSEPTEPSEQIHRDEPTISTEPGRKELTSVELAEMANRATVTVEVKCANGSGTGSGFFIDDEGTFVTCYHVIDGAEEISIKVSDGAVYPVEQIVDFDDAYDIAVLKVGISNNNYLNICENKPQQGESVYAIGSSLGFLDGTFSDGMISAASRVIGVIDYVQTTAPISPGNSGGPLINTYGEVVGICAAAYSGENTNLAISASMLNHLSGDKNWTVSQYCEWYAKEIRRSYQVWNYTDEAWEVSLTNTYHHVTGRECDGSDFSWDFLSGYSRTIVDGYHEGYGVYFYHYDVQEFDKYTSYLVENGYEFLKVEEYQDGTSYYYGNEFYGFYMDIFVTEDEQTVVLEPYCY